LDIFVIEKNKFPKNVNISKKRVDIFWKFLYNQEKVIFGNNFTNI